MKKFDCKPGPIIGKTLEAIFAEVESGTLANEREILLQRLSSLPPIPKDENGRRHEI
jgi:hypothetical protein